MPRKLPPAPTGFPWTGKFTEVVQLKKYFAAEKLQCLLCGREYGNLGLHVTRGHKVSHDDYKARFGIPWTYGLAGASFKAVSSKRFKKMIKQGKIKKPSKEHIARLHKSHRKSRPAVEAFRNESRRKILEQHGREEKWQIADYEEFIKRIGHGRTPYEVGQDKDMPSKGAFMKFIKEHPKLLRQYNKVWDSQPHSVHARSGHLTEKFYKQVVGLRRKDKSWPEIAEELDVTVAAARGAWHKWKAEGKLKASDTKHEWKRYTRADYDEYLRRVSTGRMISDVGKDKDMPQTDLFYIYMRQHPDYSKKFFKMWECLPYYVQARSRRMGSGFKNEIKRLSLQGKAIPDIAHTLGVTVSLVKAHISKI